MEEEGRKRRELQRDSEVKAMNCNEKRGEEGKKKPTIKTG